MSAKSHITWQVVGASVRGTQHIRKGAIRQDSLHWLPEYGSGPPLMLSLADGHGSPLCFRSGVGATFATIAFETCMISLVTSLPSLPDHTAINQYAKDDLPRKIYRSWMQLVEYHYSESPFLEIELTHLKDYGGESSVVKIQNHPELAYGTTVQGGLVTGEFFLGIQLGDGNILSVSNEGDIHHFTLPDISLIGDETYSLCDDRAWEQFSSWYLPLMPGAPPPAFFLFSTDGFKNSFRSADGIDLWASDLYQFLYSEKASINISQLSTNLPGWLNEVSTLGSGDDISLAMLCRNNN